MPPVANTPTRLDKSLDGARILWRWFLAADDRTAKEGHVREFTAEGDYARVAESILASDNGEWLRTADVKVVSVLEEHVEVKKVKRRRPREAGEEWKDADGGDE